MENLDIFEFNKIRTTLASFASTVLGKDTCLNLVPFATKSEVEPHLALLSEVESFCFRYGTLPLPQSSNLSLILQSGKTGNILSPHDLYLVSSDITALLKMNEYVKGKINDYPLLTALFAKQQDLTFLKSAIEKVVSPNLTVKDEASHELARIRRSLRNTEDKITREANGLLRKYSEHLAENIVTMRDGHYVIPIKTSAKNKVDGVIYDISNSGQTIFIEPSEIGQLNQNLLHYKNDELIEINTILRDLTLQVMKNETAILNNNILISELDFAFAKVKYGFSITGMIPKFSPLRELTFKNARHPLIAKEHVVANSFHLSEDFLITIISGPNAGGKTVALKTIGLLVLMAKSGLMLPVNETPTLYFYHNVYASIGDEQSLSDNLSTFSGHISKLAKIINRATSDDLVLLDELGTGTAPEEGEALAIAIADYLFTNHITSVISSHYSKLKQFAYAKDGIKNASMAFDEQKLLPLYKYRENVPGRSYGLVVAKRFGLPPHIVAKAEELMVSNQNEFEIIIGNLRKEVEEVNILQTKLQATERDLLKREQELNKLIEQAKADKQTFNEEKKSMLADEIAEVKQQMDALLKSAFKEQQQAHVIIDLKKQLDNLENVNEEVDLISFEDIHVGDHVIVTTLNVTGVVTKVREQDMSIKLASGKIMRAKQGEVTKTRKPKKTKKASVINTSFVDDLASVKPEINLIGLTTAEAIPLLGDYLARCLSKNYATVRIIHGFGTGALRRAIHEYLKTQKYVKSYELAGQFDGAGGATIVKL